MAKTYLMGDGALSEEERILIQNSKSEEDEKLKTLQQQEQQKELIKNKVTLEQLLNTKIQPHEDRVLVWPDPVELVTEGGIIKPKEVVERERPLMGTVLAVGPTKKIDETITHYLLLQILQYGSEISKDNMDKVLGEVRDYNKTPLHPGMRVLYGRFAGTQTEDPETKEPLLIMRPTDIFANL